MVNSHGETRLQGIMILDWIFVLMKTLPIILCRGYQLKMNSNPFKGILKLYL